MSNDDIDSELENFPELVDSCIVLMDFIRTFEPGNFFKSNSVWKYDPHFLELSFSYKRNHHIVVYVRGRPSEYAKMKHLPVESHGVGTFSKCYFDNISQLDALLFYVRRSHELWTRGRGRTGTRQRIIEE
jgi:hypothetical protein